MNTTTAPRRRRRAMTDVTADAPQPHQSAPNRLIYGFSRQAARRIADTHGLERMMLVIGSLILVYLGVRLWLLGARFTIDGVIYLVSLIGYRLAPSWEL